jgi:geranylgeranyl diphosphate synthase type II
MTNPETYLKQSKGLIDKALDRYLPSAKCEPRIIHRAMRYSVFSGGKRIRPIIVLEACRACAPRSRKLRRDCLKEALVIGCAVEMAHTYSLIHDDLPSMDDDNYRRGKPTSHKVFGEANAILSGDALLTLAFNILSKRLSAETSVKAIQELSEAIGTYGMVGGQVIDMAYKGKTVRPGMRKRINKLKTARLFEASARLGAIAGRAADKKIKAMAVFGESVGAAFQIVDDIMDDEDRLKLPGKDAAASRAADITCEAKDALRIFGNNAPRLREIADIMLKRRG